MVPIEGNLINFSRALFAVTASVIAAVALAVPANADVSTGPTTPISPAITADTTLTLTITGGYLEISAPSAAAALNGVADAAGNAKISSSLGLITVTDARSVSDASWNVTAYSTDFTVRVTGTDTAPAPIPADDMSYTVYRGTDGAPGDRLTQTAGYGASLLAGSSTNTSNSTTMSTVAQSVVSVSNGVGTNVVTWNPRITVSIPTTAIANDSYGAKVTHSVA